MFKPVNSWHASYAGQTVWTYQFGTNFGSDAVCQALSSRTTGAFSTQVSKCVISGGGANVEVTMGVDGTPNFWIQILSSYTLEEFTDSDKIEGSLANFGDELLTNAEVDANDYGMPTGANTPAASTTLTLAKSMNNVMDSGAVTLTFTLGVLTELTSNARMYVDIPKSYRPNLGNLFRCQLCDGEGEMMEELFCEMRWDWSLMVWGPRTATVATTAEEPVSYQLKIMGVQFSASNEAEW
jgi:hypothetical protein